VRDKNLSYNKHMNLKELLTPTRDKIKLFILLIATFVAPSVLEEYPTILYNVAAMLWFLFDTFLSYIFACVILYIWEKKGYTLSLRMLSILFPLLILITLFAFFSGLYSVGQWLVHSKLLFKDFSGFIPGRFGYR
jgi:hypothetical protein